MHLEIMLNLGKVTLDMINETWMCSLGLLDA
jgi:hypothetical protein